MEIACIVRCMGATFFVVSLQTGAQPPEGKGRPDHAGASPFIRFPVPQHSVGIMRQVELKTSRPGGPGAAKAQAERLVQTSFVVPGEPAAEKRPPLPECGAR